MAELLDPRPGETILDPCCGYGELLTAAAQHAVASATPLRAPVAAGSHADPVATTTVSPPRLKAVVHSDRAHHTALINAAVHGLPVEVATGTDRPPSITSAPTAAADVIVSNPPFTADIPDSEAAAGAPDPSTVWPYGPPPTHRPAFAWLQIVLTALTPGSGRAAIVMPRAATDPQHPQERAILTGMVDAGVIRCVIDLPSHLFRETTTPVSVWIIGRGAAGPSDQILLIDAASCTERLTPTHRVITDAGRHRIVAAWQNWSSGGPDMRSAGPESTDLLQA
jgi:type I restriction enzyme M protein